MEIRFFIGLVIKLFLFVSIFISNFAFSFVVNESHHSTSLVSCSPYSGKTLGACISASKAFVISFNKNIPITFTNDTLSYGAFISGYHKYALFVNYYYIASTGERIYRYDRMEVYFTSKLPEPPTCNSNQVLNPETNTCVPAPTCPAEGTKDKSSYGPPNLLGFSACTANNCIIQVGTTDGLSLCTGGGTADEQCAYTTYYTGQACTYNPDNTTWNPPAHEWPEVPKPDLPVPDQPDLPLPDSGGGNGGYDPDAGIEDNFTPPNPDTSPDTDNPNLVAEGNAGVVNELNSANKSLQNIEAILTQTRKDQNENAATQERYNSGILGAINSIDKSVSGASGSGGGGGNGDGDSGSGCDPEKEQCESGLNFGRPEVKDPFENILDASDIAEVQAKTTDIKTSLKSKIDEIKNLISVPKYETGGSVPAVEFSLQHGDSNIQVKNDALSRISPDIANIITLVVAVICFGIVAARR
ncbi:hypothetical protein VCSRO190_2524 [Vibrio cholerae]|nr:hypothetical protein VCSRO190_2524 [Vibrio cholerae]